MQKLQRKAGLFLPRSADDAQVGLLLKDFDDGDKILKSIIEQTKAFRIAWTEILQRASGTASDFESIYQFIAGDPEDNHRYRPTEREQLEKVKAFKDTIAHARDTIIQELGDVERRVSGPAKETRKQIDIYRKVVKRREDRKLDWERYKSRTEALEQKSSRSERDNNALMKHQIDLEASGKAYEIADGHLRDTLPGLTRAIYAILPYLIEAQAMCQNTLFGHYYTAMHDFCQRYGYPIPSSDWQQIQSEFEDTFPPIRKETETIQIVQKGKSISSPFYSRPDSMQTTTIPSRNKIPPVRSNGSLPPPVPISPPTIDFGSKPSRTVSNQSYPRPSPSPSPSIASYQSSDYLSSRPSGPGAQRPQITSHLSAPHGVLSRATSSGSIGSVASAAAKKKPPPPPPPKKKPSSLQQDYVVAQYDFAGQGDGDLPFREGDKIRVVKRTNSTNDWWEGECHGVQGSFPANYCKPL